MCLGRLYPTLWLHFCGSHEASINLVEQADMVLSAFFMPKNNHIISHRRELNKRGNSNMGQTSNKHYRVGESSNGDFLSPAIGTFTSPIKFLPYMVGIFGLAFLASCITASIMTPVQNSDATTGVSLSSSAVSYFVNIASATNGTAGVISKDIQATYAGTLGTIEDQLRITSNTPQGYKVYVSMNGMGETAQRLVNTTDSSYYLKPIEGNGVIDTSAAASLANPGTLSANSWGVAVNSAWNYAFDSTYTNITQNSRFAPVPVKGAEELLITQDDTTTTETRPITLPSITATTLTRLYLPEPTRIRYFIRLMPKLQTKKAVSLPIRQMVSITRMVGRLPLPLHSIRIGRYRLAMLVLR